MICQNCNKNDATLHMKRIINGRAAEVHLCSDCARSLGYGEAFSGFGLGFGHLLGELLSSNENGSANSMRCPACGKSFEEIAEMMNLTEAAVRMKLSRARKRIRTVYQEQNKKEGGSHDY